MTIDQLIAGAPEQVRPIVAEYGPAIIKMTAEEFAAWVKLLLMGKTDEAWANVLSKLDNADLLAAWDRVGEKWDVANARNAARLQLQRDAGFAVLRILLAAALASVGL